MDGKTAPRQDGREAVVPVPNMSDKPILATKCVGYKSNHLVHHRCLAFCAVFCARRVLRRVMLSCSWRSEERRGGTHDRHNPTRVYDPPPPYQLPTITTIFVYSPTCVHCSYSTSSCSSHDPILYHPPPNPIHMSTHMSTHTIPLDASLTSPRKRRWTGPPPSSARSTPN